MELSLYFCNNILQIVVYKIKLKREIWSDKEVLVTMKLDLYPYFELK